MLFAVSGLSACLHQPSVYDCQHAANYTCTTCTYAAFGSPTIACFQVQVDKDRTLIISGERKKYETEMDVKWRQKKMERRFGAFQRKFQLPEDADVNKIKGKAENGVLSITISKIPKEDVPSDSTSIPIY